VICYLDIEHEQALRASEERSHHAARCDDVRRRLESISGDSCTIKRYDHIDQDWVRVSGVRAIVTSGNVTDWSHYDPAHLRRLADIIRAATVPILGICGGCQLIGMAHGAPLGPMGRLEADRDDPCPAFAPGYVKEWGFVPVSVVRPDPLFDGLGPEPVFLAAHYWEVKEVPPGFDLLASTEMCRVQAIRHVDKPLYGTQFHPEAYVVGPDDRRSRLVNLVYPSGYPRAQMSGRVLLENFLRLAAAWWDGVE
jgi:GMP synthase-like glutamine amidotransferase